MKVKSFQYQVIVISIFTLLLFHGHAFADSFSFAVTGDPMGDGETWVNALTEIRDMNVNPAPQFDNAEFVICAGDIAPIDLRHKEFNKVFENQNIPFLPVVGNHEFDDVGGWPGGPTGPPPGKGGKKGDKGGKKKGPPRPKGPPGDPSIIDFDYLKNEIIPAIPNVVRRNENSGSFYYDHKSVRIISADGYSGEFGINGVITAEGKDWVEGVIKSAPASIDHIFVTIHAPAFPRVRHTGDSFNASPEERDAFWNMLRSHQDKVHGLFVAHTHYYYRMKVADPTSEAANDFKVYPKDADGIDQIDVGAVGRGKKSTFLQVKVDGKDVSFRVLEAENGKDQAFSVKDEWKL